MVRRLVELRARAGERARERELSDTSKFGESEKTKLEIKMQCKPHCSKHGNKVSNLLRS